MLTNTSEFQVMLERYDDDPGLCSKVLRTHALSDPKIFLEYAQAEILQRPVSRVLKFITGLAISAGLIDRLPQLYIESRVEAVAFARKVLLCDPRFDSKLAEYLLHPEPGKVPDENAFYTILDILDVVSEGDRLVASVLKLLKHANPKVRSKAALFVGSRTQNVAWAVSFTQDYDGRVRANILESLFGLNSEFVHELFRSNIDDENNRVAGNAVLGLYLLGNTASIPLIHKMAKHPNALFRNTSAWLMGRTGDPRFANAFSELMSDPEPLVRAQAFKGLGEVRKALRAAANRKQLRASIAKVTRNAEPHSLLATVYDATGQPVRGIPPTSFILKSGSPGKFVREFTVSEYDCRSSLSLAFIMCLPADDEKSADTRFTEAIQCCNSLRRSKDRWAIAKISGAATSANRPGASTADIMQRYKQRGNILNVDHTGPSAATPQENPFGYSSAQHRIDAMLRESPVSVGGSPDNEAARLMVENLLRSDIGWGKPHLVFLGGGPTHNFLEVLRARGPDVPAVVHVIALSAVWRDPAIQQLAESTGGVYRQVGARDLSQACFDIHASLMHHYQLQWNEGGEPLELNIYAEAGKASAAYESGPAAEEHPR